MFCIVTVVAWAASLGACGGTAQPPGSTGDFSGGGPTGPSGSAGSDGGLRDASDANDRSAERHREGAFIERVVGFTPGLGAGFGQDAMPWVVFGGPRGAGPSSGGTDVVSLGTGGSIVVAFEKRPIIDAPGEDFIVFENAFRFGTGGTRAYVELARVSVSDDGVNWVSFPCNVQTYAGCAGSQPVYANLDTNTIDATLSARAGGDPFDLASVGLSRARFLRLDDLGTIPGSAEESSGKAGFDLDSIAVIHGADSP